MDIDNIVWNEEWDVIIIGSGFAGVSAGCAAIEKLKKGVVILEKMQQLGGNSCITSGWLSVPCCKEQLAANVTDDSPDIFYNDIIKYGEGLSDNKLVRVLADNAKSAYDYLVSHGAVFLEKATLLAGHSKARSPIPAAGIGLGLLMPLQHHFIKSGGIFKTCCFARQIITDNDGKAIGVMVWENYKFDGNEESHDKNIKFYKARKAVIVGTGGFAADKRLCAALDNRVNDATEHTNHVGATSYSLYMLMRAGAATMNLSCIQWGPWCSPDECGYGTAPDLCDFMRLYGIALDPRTGTRVFNEHADRTRLTETLLKTIHKDSEPVYPVLFCGNNLEHETPQIYINKALRAGVAHKFKTIKSLAEFYCIDTKKMKQTIKRYNSFVISGIDADFGKDFNRIAGQPITKGPFYAMRMTAKIHYTTGGIKINEHAQVIESITNEPIKNLYAAGEVTGGLHGRTRLGGNSIMEAIVFGRIAGLHCLN